MTKAAGESFRSPGEDISNNQICNTRGDRDDKEPEVSNEEIRRT
jgi:hypothetical protein